MIVGFKLPKFYFVNITGRQFFLPITNYLLLDKILLKYQLKEQIKILMALDH